MAETPEDQASADGTQGQSNKDVTAIAGPQNVTIPQPPPAPPEDRSAAEQCRWTNDPAMFWVTLAGVLAVIAYTSVAAWQACLTRDQLSEMQKAYGPIKESADAARDSADSTASELKVMQGQLEEMRLVRQPFVYFQNLTFETDPNSTAQFVTVYAYPNWKNAGNGPTNRLRLVVFCNTTGPSDFDFRQDGTLPRILAPQQVDGGGRCHVMITQISNISGTIGNVWIGGKATYFDGPDSTKVRVTEFCQSAPIVRVPFPNAFQIRAGMDGTQFCDVSPSRNCADNDCPAEDRQ